MTKQYYNVYVATKPKVIALQIVFPTYTGTIWLLSQVTVILLHMADETAQTCRQHARYHKKIRTTCENHQHTQAFWAN